MTSPRRPPLIVWWAFWAANQIGILVIFFFLNQIEGKAPPPAGAASVPWFFGLGPLVLATTLRWFVLPAFSRVETALSIFVFGIGIAGAGCFLGLFVFPTQSVELFAASVLGIAQFVPVFAKRYYSPDVQNDR